MYAIVEIAGKQFRVAKDMQIQVPYLEGDAGAKIDFNRVYMVEDEKGNITLGKPIVSNTSVSAKIVEHGREKKIIVFKKKRRKGYQKKNGHRQDFSLIEITGIGAAKKPADKKTSAAGAAQTKKQPAAKTTATPKKTAPATKKKSTTPAAAGEKKTVAKIAPAAAKAQPAKTKPAAKATTAKKSAAKKSKPAENKDVKED